MVKYIYAGYSKCGTKTIAQAFRILGYKVHDYEEGITETSSTWTDFFRHHENTSEKSTPEYKLNLLKNGLKNFDIVIDSPCHIIWYEILQAFPDAKVIFYQRPVDEWWPSFLKQITSFQNLPMSPDFIRHKLIYYLNPSMLLYTDYCSLLTLFYGHNVSPFKSWNGKKANFDEIFAKRMYRKHNSDVLSNCPSERLLILESINCGWEVVCEFTGDKIPEGVDWPHENKNCALTAKVFGTDENRDTRVMRFLKEEAKGHFKRYCWKGFVYGSVLACFAGVFMNYGRIKNFVK